MWLDRDMRWLAAPSGKRGRRQTFSDAAIQFCLSIKCLFGLALRRTLGLVESLLRLAGLDWPVPDYSTVCRRQKTLQAQITYRPSAEPLQLLVDSTGSSSSARVSGSARSTGPSTAASGARCIWASTRRRWRSVRSRSRAMRLATRRCCPSCWRRSRRTDRCQRHRRRRLRHEGVPGRDRAARRGGSDRTAQERSPVAPLQSGIRVPKRGRPGMPAPGHKHLEDVGGYHRRSLVETKMHCLKRLGERVTARTFERQVVELHVRVAVLNRFSQIGRPQTVPVGAVA